MMNKLISTAKSVAGHELISGSFYIFLGVTVSSFLAFILNIYFARELSYADYGIFSSLLSVVTLLTIPSTALTAVIVRYATIFFSKGEKVRAGAFYVKSFKYLIVFSFILNFVFLLIFPFFSNFLKIDQLGLVVLSSLSVAMFYLATLNMAFLQSMLRFRLLGALYALAGVGKLLSGVILVFLGLKVYGALLATFFFSLIDFVFSLFPLKELVVKPGKEVNIGTRDFTSYAIPTALAIFSLSSFISTDVLLVKHFFSATEAGFYGGMSLVGKVIFYFTGPIPIAMFPLIIKRHADKQSYKNLFYLSIVLVLIPSVFITIFYFLFPEFTINLFLGKEGYLVMAPFLGLFGIFLTIYSINNVFVSFFVSLKKILVSIIALFWAMVQIFLIFVFHDNFYQIIYVSIASSLLLLGSLVLYYLKSYGFNYTKK